MTWTRGQLSAISRTKRFDELFKGDPAFRRELLVDPPLAVQRHKLEIDPQTVRPVWESSGAGTIPVWENIPPEALPPALALYRSFRRNEPRWPELSELARCSGNARYHAWRERQIARCRGELGFDINGSLIHAPLAVELSQGCSVGCWFCGVGAEKLTAHFRYQGANVSLWRETLVVLQDLLGPAVGAGFLYWASDPLDHPEYEQFLGDFHERTGVQPQTTTALALQDVPRTRRLLETSLARGCRINRFSVLSTGMLRSLHEQFTPEELLHVELVMQMPRSSSLKSPSGRALAARQSAPQRHADHTFEEGWTIACVTGFLLNMVKRTVRLISPCRPDDRWPLGYRVYTEREFTHPDSLHRAIEDIIEQHMPLEVPADEMLRFRRDLTFEPLADGFRLQGRHHARVMRGAPFLSALGKRILTGNASAQEVAADLAAGGESAAAVFAAIERLRRNGYLDDEPPAAPAPVAIGEVLLVPSADLQPAGALAR